MPRLSLVHPVFLAQDPVELAASSPYFPLGLLYLASYVRDRGHAVAIFDGTFEDDETAFTRHLDEHRPEVVGISAVITSRQSALTLASIAAERDLVVVLGGPDPTANPHAYLADPAVDIVVHHEGEQTIARLLDIVGSGSASVDSFADEPGLAFRRHGVVCVNPPRPPIKNLDELPLPARDLIDMDRYLHLWDQSSGYTSITVSTSRGCPHGCEWCDDAVHGAEFRQRSPENVAAEIKQLKTIYRPQSIRLVDDVDGLDRGWFDQWTDALDDIDGAIPFEALNGLERTDLPLLEVRDSL